VGRVSIWGLTGMQPAIIDSNTTLKELRKNNVIHRDVTLGLAVYEALALWSRSVCVT